MRLSLICLLLFVAFRTNAALLPPVLVDGREWLQPIDFVGLGWHDIAAVCSPATGVCDGLLGDNDMTGWSWASLAAVNALFNHYIGSAAMGPGVDRFYGVAEYGERFFGDGWIPTGYSFGGYAANTTGFFADWTNLVAFYGYFPRLGVTTIRSDVLYPSSGLDQVGAWFSRPAQVPVPATLPLFCAALAGLWSVRGRRALSKPPR